MHPAVELLQLLFTLVYSTIRAFVTTFLPVSLRAKNISGQTVFITGSGSGIGKCMALKFSALKCRLVLVDINKDSLAGAADECRKAGAEDVKTYVCDLSNRDAVNALTAKVKDEIGAVDILVNNAGIVSGKPILELDDEKNIDRTFKINVLCHFWLIKAFLPEMLRRQQGHIVTIASMAGIVSPTTKQTDYASSKYAAVGLAETLEFELRCHYKTTAVKQTLVCPYYVNSGMFHGVSLKYEWLLPYMTVDYVAQKTIDGVLTDQPIVMLPPWLRSIAWLKYVLPSAFWIHLADVLGTTQSMTTFVGRK